MFEGITVDPIVTSVVALLGIGLGLLVGLFLLPGPREVKRLRAEIERLGQKHADYQSLVTGHFEKTGELIGQMTASYKAVYDHLADGAQSLCGPDALPKPLFAAPRLIIDESVSVGDVRVQPTAARDETLRFEPPSPTPSTHTDEPHTLEAAATSPASTPTANGPDTDAAAPKIEAAR
jgi:uncharacterized membrane-anchored protein YhcB (DUF1043 family)